MSATAIAAASPQLDRAHDMSSSIHALMLATVPRPATPQPDELPASGTLGAMVRLSVEFVALDVVTTLSVSVDVRSPSDL